MYVLSADTFFGRSSTNRYDEEQKRSYLDLFRMKIGIVFSQEEGDEALVCCSSDEGDSSSQYVPEDDEESQ
jgi:hypothetical protein